MPVYLSTQTFTTADALTVLIVVCVVLVIGAAVPRKGRR